jgi:protein phosphatase
VVTRFDQIEQATLTDVGVRRSHNQDSHAVQLAADEGQWSERGHLFLVADGMGAHAVGEKASELAARVIPHIYHKSAQQGPTPALRKAFIEANASIHACGQQNREFEGMGTTCTALLLRPEGAWIGHVGDSRAYRVRNGVIEQLTYDHSLVWDYAHREHIDPDDVQDIPANVINRCLGVEPFVQVDVEGPHPVHAGDTFLLCSDGLSGQVSDLEIGAVVSVLPPTEACRFLVDLANLRGGPDNITAVIVRVGGNPQSNGIASPPPPPAVRGPLLLTWWLPTLASGTLLAVAAAVLQYSQWAGSVYVFLLALATFLAGLIGLLQHYLQEKRREMLESEDLAGPRVHRRTSCRIERALVDRLTRALQALRQRADEKHWEPDWNEYQEHTRLAEDLVQHDDLPGAFRESCRALLPFTRALERQRNKEERFQPVWDKTH